MNRTTRTRGWVTMQNLSERVRERSLLGSLPRISASVAAHILLGAQDGMLMLQPFMPWDTLRTRRIA